LSRCDCCRKALEHEVQTICTKGNGGGSFEGYGSCVNGIQEGIKINGHKLRAFYFLATGHCASADGKNLQVVWAPRGDRSLRACQYYCASRAQCTGIEWQWAGEHGKNCFIYEGHAEIATHVRLLHSSQRQDVACYKKLASIVGVEGSHSAGCFQKDNSIPFYSLLAQPKFDSRGGAHVGPFPNIFHYYRSAGLWMPLEHAKRNLGNIEDPETDSNGLLTYSGKNGEMILPTLDGLPLLRALGKDEFLGATIKVGINSDSSCDGLGIIVEASPQINETEEHLESYTFNGYGVHLNRNVIKVSPNLNGWDLRVEGPGGFEDQPMGFVFLGWSDSQHKLHTIEVSVSADGANEVSFHSADGLHIFKHVWQHKLFDGRDIPSVYAFIDLGGEHAKPLIIGPVSLAVPH